MDPRTVELAQAGDRAAFRSIAETSGNRLKHVAYRILRDPHLAEDATQQALTDIWRSLPSLRDPAKFDAWSYRIVVRACKREATRRDVPASSIHDQSTPAIADATGLVHDRDQLDRGFQRLSVDQRAVLVLHYFLDLTIEDTAEALGISVGTASSRLHRALKSLRLALHTDAPAARRSQEPAR